MKSEILKQAHINEQAATRRERGDQLIESYAKREEVIGSENKWIASANENPAAMRRTAIALNEQEKYMRNLNETTISGAFPIPLQNLLRVIRLTYPNMIFPEIYTSFQMQAWHDAIYYIDTVIGTTKRGGTEGQKTFETALSRYTTEVELATIDATGASTNYPGTIGGVVIPLVPYKVVLYVGDSPIASDNGAGIFTDVIYAPGTLSASTESTIDYSNGDFDITFASAPGQAITVEYNFDSEVSDNFDEIGSVDIRVRDYQFRPRPVYTGVSWSHMAELQLKGTLNADIGDILTSASVDLIRQNKDISHLRFGYGIAKKKTPITWDANYVSSNTYSMKDHLDTLTYAIGRASASIYDATNRGAVTKMYGTSKTVTLISQHRNFVPDTSMLAIGPHKVGTVNGIDVYQVPNAVMYDANDAQAVDDLCLVYKDSADEGNVAIAIGEYTPIASTAELEYGNGTQGFVKEKGIYSTGDRKVLNASFLTRIRMLNIPTK